MMEKDGGRRIADFARWAQEMNASDHVPDGSFRVGDGERDSFEPSNDWDAVPHAAAPAGCATGTPSATQSASANVMADTTLSDSVTLSDRTSALASVTPSDGITLLEGSELDAGAGDAGEKSRDASDAVAVANPGDGMSPRGENSENVTNEAKSDETAIIIQNKEPVGVAANSGVHSGLDNREERPGRADGKDEGLNQESQLIRDIMARPPRAAETLRPHLPRSP
jgi:hypothetical protein